MFTAFHFPEVRTNLLIGPSADVNTSCPEYKVVAVSRRARGRGAGAAAARLGGARAHRVAVLAALEGVAAGMLARVERDGGSDEVAVELPLEIRLNGEPVAVTMRTPGQRPRTGRGLSLRRGHRRTRRPR